MYCGYPQPVDRRELGCAQVLRVESPRRTIARGGKSHGKRLSGREIRLAGSGCVGIASDRSGAIDWLELPSFHLKRRIRMGKTDRGEPFTREGMAIRGSELLLLPEDGPSRLFVFRLKSPDR